MAITSEFSNIASITRASKGWYDGWDGQDGTAVGTLTEYASGVARVGPDGLLVEVATTNECRNPRAEGSTNGDLAGAGALPTNWVAAYSGGTITIIGTGAESGWPYIDIRFNGTFAGETFLEIEAPTQVSAAQSETWTFSMGLRLVGGSDPAGARIGLVERDSGGGFEAYDRHAVITLDGTHRRYFQTATLSDADTAAVTGMFYLDAGLGAVDFTVRIYCPQLEEKAYPTSTVLPTVSSPAAATRAKDDIEIAAGSWLSDEPYSVYCRYKPRKTGLLEYVWSTDDGSVGDYFAAYLNGAGHNVITVENSSITETKTAADAGIGAGDDYSLAVRLAADDFALSVNGLTQVTDSSWSLPTSPATALVLGANPGNSNQLNGYIRDFRFWPRSLTDAELEALVGN